MERNIEKSWNGLEKCEATRYWQILIDHDYHIALFVDERFWEIFFNGENESIK
jgi:hypothetical protein